MGLGPVDVLMADLAYLLERVGPRLAVAVCIGRVREGDRVLAAIRPLPGAAFGYRPLLTERYPPLASTLSTTRELRG